ncbi:MAG: hypothetical protein QCI82_00420 [Candidatus Thermoplasmatota archaeon]|nr:hypothetical protein [Candidatus Thermoplasmatota archaeon]
MEQERLTGERDPTVALVIQLCIGWVSFFGCLGYFYIGQWQKALAFILAQLIITPLTIITMGMVGPLNLVLYVVSVVDVYMQAKQLKRGRAIGHWTFFDQTV